MGKLNIPACKQIAAIKITNLTFINIGKENMLEACKFYTM